MRPFDIINFLSGLTSFVFSREVLENVARKRKAEYITSSIELTSKQEDLMLADLYFVIYTSPKAIASFKHSHGDYSESVGSQSVADKSDLYDMMTYIYKRYDEIDMLERLSSISSKKPSMKFIDNELYC